MAKCVPRSAIFVLFPLLLFFTVIAPVYGSGGREAVLTRADSLIAEKEYEEAILILSDFARRNPNNFDQAQQRLRKIYQIRDEFNRTADELIWTLLNDPENNEQILALTTKLYTLEKEDSPLLANFIHRTRDIAQFNVSRNRLRSILERGRGFLDRGDSAAAIQVYAEGMDFMRDEFFASGYGDSIENDVRRETERINAAMAAFSQTSAQMSAISAELSRAVAAGDITRINEITGRLTPAIDRFIALKQELYTTDVTFNRILNTIRARDPEMIDRNHLSFLLIVIHGRTEEDIQEGMLGAFDAYWRNAINPVITAVTEYIQRSNAAAITAFNGRNYAAAAASLDRTESYVNLSTLLFGRHRQLISGSAPQTITLFGNNILQADIPPYLEIRALSEANNALLQASNAGSRMNIDRSSFTRWQEGTINTTQALNSEQQTRSSITGIQNSISSIRTSATQANTEINSYHTTAHITNTLTVIETLSTALLAEERQSAQRYYNIAYNSLQNNLVARRSELERGRALLNGESRTSANGIVTVYRYPTEALEELTAMLSASAIDLQGGNAALTQFRSEPAAISNFEDISGTLTRHQTAVNELTEVRAQGLALIETARTRSSQAEAFRQEGERLLREAQAAFQRQDYDVARERIQRASDRFNDSLEIQESASLRQVRDTQLVSLGQSINIAENENIITEVRNMINAARNSYFNGNFQQAEDSLLRARNRWRVTNPDENEEIIYWLGIVRTAMSASSDRVIPPTAPLYAEMSQLLSQAQRNYEEGVRHINAGQRALGIAKFDEARQLAREVRLMFPVNQEAGILELRIEQFLDPAAFNAMFEQRVRTAIAGTRMRSIEAFADLQNLAEINPRYPNMRAILNQAEIDMGYRPPPINPANIARSNELTASASRIVETNATAQYEVALAQLNEAITLNPNNTQAPQVRDRLLSRMSVPGGIVLSSEDEAEYQRALRELNSGNNLVALALVERLMQNPRNRNITKLIELHRRIQSVL
ncbi:MAG: hypothetical protein FWD22_02850 [Treponema sp.]|nr:hypothetical protein [Treponema sp.]